VIRKSKRDRITTSKNSEKMGSMSDNWQTSSQLETLHKTDIVSFEAMQVNLSSKNCNKRSKKCINH